MLSKKIFKSWRTDIRSMAVPYADSVLKTSEKCPNYLTKNLWNYKNFSFLYNLWIEIFINWVELNVEKFQKVQFHYEG